GDERGEQRQARDRHEEEDDERDGKPGVADVAAERDVVGAAALDKKHGHEHDRDEHGCPEAEVRPLLRGELGEFPAVDARDGGHTAAASATGSAGRSWSEDSPPVMPRKSSSRLAVSRTRAGNAIRAWPSATLSA